MSHTALSTEEPIFVCGVPKSGTTMVGNLLSNHEDLKTNYDIDVSIRFLRYVQSSMKDYFFFIDRGNTPMGAENDFWIEDDFREWHLMNLRYFQVLHQSYRDRAPRWGSSTCLTYLYRNLIWKWFPKATFLMVQRDPRDHWCSYKHLYLHGINDDVGQWNSFVHYRKNTFPSKNEDPRIKFVEYHEVVNNPSIVFDTLGLSTPKNYLNNVEGVYLVRSVGDVGYDPIQGLREGGPMVTSRIGRWKRDLSEDEIRRCTETFPHICNYYDLNV